MKLVKTVRYPRHLSACLTCTIAQCIPLVRHHPRSKCIKGKPESQKPNPNGWAAGGAGLHTAVVIVAVNAANVGYQLQPSRSCDPSTPLPLSPSLPFSHSLSSYLAAREQHALLSKQWRIIKIRPQTICKRGESSCETMATATSSSSSLPLPSQNKWPTLESPAGRGREHEQRLPRHMLINIFMFAEVLGVPAPAGHKLLLVACPAGLTSLAKHRERRRKREGETKRERERGRVQQKAHFLQLRVILISSSCVYVCTRISIKVWIYGCMCVDMYVYDIYVCVYVCIYVCTSTSHGLYAY